MKKIKVVSDTFEADRVIGYLMEKGINAIKTPMKPKGIYGGSANEILLHYCIMVPEEQETDAMKLMEEWQDETTVDNIEKKESVGYLRKRRLLRIIILIWSMLMLAFMIALCIL